MTDRRFGKMAVTIGVTRERENKLMAIPPDKKTIQDIFESLTIIRKGTEDDFELRASADEKVWGVKLWDDASRPTFLLYAGTDAKDLACDAADYDLDDEEEEENDEDEEETEEEDD
jgi:hypothetical protein